MRHAGYLTCFSRVVNVGVRGYVTNGHTNVRDTCSPRDSNRSPTRVPDISMVSIANFIPCYQGVIVIVWYGTIERKNKTHPNYIILVLFLNGFKMPTIKTT